MICVYVLKNKATNEMYIGSSRNFKERRQHHLSDLKHLRHHNRLIKQASIVYGPESFDISVLEECTPGDLIKREQYYINKFKPAYNISPTADTSYPLSLGHGWNQGVPFSKESRRKMSEAKLKKPVIRLSQEGEPKEYESISEAARDGFHPSHISECCRGVIKTHKGYRWLFKEENYAR